MDPITQYILDEQEELRISKYVMEYSFWERTKFLFGTNNKEVTVMSKDQFDNAISDAYPSGFKGGVRGSGYQSGFDVGSARGTHQGISQGVEQGIKQGTEQGIEQGKHDVMVLFSVLAVVGLITAVGVLIYQNYFSDAARACEYKKGKEKKICMLKYRMQGLTRKAATLSGNANAHCHRSKNTGKCKAIIAKKVNGINDDINKIKYKIKKMA